MVPPLPVKSVSSLAAPVGHLMRPTLTCTGEDSIQRAVGELRRNGGGLLPVVSTGVLMGVVTESSLVQVLAEGRDLLEPCANATAEAFTIAPYASGAEAMRLLTEQDLPSLVVVDDLGHVLGIISPSDLFPRKRNLPRPDPVGGMATPFGVYLTSGGLSGGVPIWAVVATGATMFSMFAAGNVIASYAEIGLAKTTMPALWNETLCQGLAIALFALIMRLAPLSGIHGAEHMVVHAMERGEELTPEVVSRMPRVHPRCGTNLAVAMTLFMSIAFTEWVSDPEIRVLVAALVTLFFWKPLGSFAQQYITTRKPNDKQIRSGIKAATELIDRYSTTRVSTASIPKRFWNSGMLQVMTGGFIAYWMVRGVLFVFHLNIPGLE